MPTDALPLDSPMLPPLVLRPPLGPRILRGLVMVLAAIFHLCTAGWSLITNGPEGDLAGVAKTLFREHRWLLTSHEWAAGPLPVWLTKVSYGFFGISEFAARLPAALAAVATVWFTFRIAERFGGIWRGFVAGLLLLCCPGMFTIARVLTPAPFTVMFISAGFYFLLRGSERRPNRREWYFLAWIAFGLSYFCGGWRALAVPILSGIALACFYREARMRFPALFSWEGAGAAVVLAICALAFKASPGKLEGPALPYWELAAWQIGLLFPWSILLIPAKWRMLVGWLRGYPLEWQEAFPLIWATAGLVLVLADPGRTIFESMLFWPGFAVWAATRLETMPRLGLLRAMGVILASALASLFVAGRLQALLGTVSPARSEQLHGIPDFFWPSITSVAFVAILAFILLAGAGFWLEVVHRRRFALLAIFGAMIPAGYAFTDTMAKFAPYLSLADIARCMTVAPNARTFYDGDPERASSLKFYFDEPFSHVPADTEQVVELWNQPGRVYLVTRRSRLPVWNQRVGKQLKPAFQSGVNILLSNAPDANGP